MKNRWLEKRQIVKLAIEKIKAGLTHFHAHQRILWALIDQLAEECPHLQVLAEPEAAYPGIWEVKIVPDDSWIGG